MEEGRRRMMEEINLTYIVSTHIIIAMYPPEPLLYANKIF
jgi:hypothetical protein